MTDIYIGATKATLIGTLEAAIEEIKHQPEGMVSHTIYGKSAPRGRDMNITFSDEDMDRPEVADMVLVDVEEGAA